MEGVLKPAVTRYSVLASSGGLSLLKLQPQTGRKHQLRVHCAELLKAPIVGDYRRVKILCACLCGECRVGGGWEWGGVLKPAVARYSCSSFGGWVGRGGGGGVGGVWGMGLAQHGGLEPIEGAGRTSG